jgi:hypothetical protein
MRRLFACFLALFLLGGGVLLVNWPSFGDGRGPGDSSSEEPPPESCSVEEVISDDLKERGFESSEFSIDDVTWAQNPRDNVGGAFHGRVETRHELSRFLRGDASVSRAARNKLLGEIPSGERARALSGRGYTPVQFHVPVDYTGNSLWSGDRVITPDGVKRAKTGDVVWVYVTQACDVFWSASVRADCGNVGYHDLVPVRID